MAKQSFNEHWVGDINGKEYSHSRVFKISGDKFYALLSGSDTALFDLYKILPKAIDDFLATANLQKKPIVNSALSEIKQETISTKRSILDQITFENYSYYLGFDKL